MFSQDATGPATAGRYAGAGQLLDRAAIVALQIMACGSWGKKTLTE
jgi:hypothetical protein